MPCKFVFCKAPVPGNQIFLTPKLSVMKKLLISAFSLMFGFWYFLPVVPHTSVYSGIEGKSCSATGDLGGSCSITCPDECAACQCTGHTFGCSCECIGCGGSEQAFIQVDVAPREVLQKAKSLLALDGSEVALQIIEQLNELELLDPAISPEAIKEKLILLDELVAQLPPATASELKEGKGTR